MHLERYKKINERKVSSDSDNYSLIDDDVINDDYFTPDNQSSNEIDSGLDSFLSENSDETCDRLQSITGEKQGGNVAKRIDEENVARVDKLLEHRSISPFHHKQL